MNHFGFKLKIWSKSYFQEMAPYRNHNALSIPPPFDETRIKQLWTMFFSWNDLKELYTAYFLDFILHVHIFH